MSFANNKISTVVEGQIPEFIREDHHNFVEFVKSYYEFLEQVTPPVDIPLLVDNPNKIVYTAYNPYGKSAFQVGEIIEQYANDNDPTDVTASATVFASVATSTKAIVTVTTIGGSLGRFLRNREIIGKTSGAKWWPAVNVTQSPTGTIQAAYDISNIRDLDQMTTQYLKFIKREIASGLPVNFTKGVDTRTALKNLRDFYQSKGTEHSFRLLFRLVFGEDIDIFLPKDIMLRPSVGEFEERVVLRISPPDRDSDVNGASRDETDIIGQLITGQISGATAIIERAQRILYAGSAFTEIDISDKNGTFIAGELLRVAYTDFTTNQPIAIECTNYGTVTDINVIDGGSNYAVGDRIEVQGDGRGLLAEVSEVDDVTGAIKRIRINDPGVGFTSVPTITIRTPHGGESGSLRFNQGKLETILDYKLNAADTANTFFAESDNRAGQANTGAVGFSLYDINNATVRNPAGTDANSFSNFITIPGKEKGLEAYWKFSSYNITPKAITINTKDGTFRDGNDPVANLTNQGYWGPRVGDSVFTSNPRDPAFGYGNLNVLNINQPSQNALSTNTVTSNTFNIYMQQWVTNTYNTAGITGFKPIVLDSSGNQNHAWVQTTDVLAPAAGFTGRANVFSKGAFSANGIYQLPDVATVTTANSWVNGPNGVDDQKSLGGVVLRSHDDLRNANTQTWVMWYYPYGEIGYFGGTYNNDTAWAQYASTAAQFDANNAPNILSRDGGAYWALQANATSTSSSDYHDVIFRFQGATWDNGNAANGQIANTSGLYPGHISGTLNAGGGSLRAQTWNMIALSIDYTNHVGNLYFFNTVDGFHSSNGFSIDASVDSNTVFSTALYSGSEGWPVLNGDTEGRAVVMGAASASANGDSNSVEQNPASSAHGRYAEVRYYNKALDEQDIALLFKNPGGRFNKTLLGDWAIVNPLVSGNTATEVRYDETEDAYHVRVGCDDATTGFQLVFDESFVFDPTAHYKMSVKAKNNGADTANVQFGLATISNNGTTLVGYSNNDDWDYVQPIVQSGTGLGTSWVIKNAVFGGNTSQSGWAAEGSGEGTYTWENPAKLYGDSSLATSNATYYRPVLRWTDWGAGLSTDIEYIKIEAQREAILSASIAGEFEWPSRSIGDAGKLSTSSTNSWTPQYLSDNNFYQTYSYVIRSGLSINRYKDLVERMTHTSGKKLFGEVNLTSKVSITPEVEAFVDSLLKLFVIFYSGAEEALIGDTEENVVSEDNVSITKWDSRSLKGDVAIKSDFGLYNHTSQLPFDLDLAHGEFDILGYNSSPSSNDITLDFAGCTTTSAHIYLDQSINQDPAILRHRWRNYAGAGTPSSDGVIISTIDTPAASPWLIFYSDEERAFISESFNINGADYPYVRVLMRKLSGRNGYWSGTLYFGAKGEYAVNNNPYNQGSLDVEEPQWGNDFEWVTWDMSRISSWSSNIITSLSFHFERLWPYESFEAGFGYHHFNDGQDGQRSDSLFEIKKIQFVHKDSYRYGTNDGPAWIAWDQSPNDMPYAKQHYSYDLLPDPTFATSNTATRPTKTSLIWEVTGAHSRLVSAYEESYDASRAKQDISYSFIDSPTYSSTYPANYVEGTDVTQLEFGSLPYLSPQTRWTARSGFLSWETSDPGSDGYMVLKHNPAAAVNYPNFDTGSTPDSFGTNIRGKDVKTVRVRMKRTSDTSPDDAAWSGTMYWGLGYDGADNRPEGALDGYVLPNDYPFGALGSLNTTQPTWGSDWHDVDWDVSTTWEDVKNIGDIRFDFDRNAGATPTPNIYYVESITFIMKGGRNVRALDGHARASEDSNDGIFWQNTQGLPLDIDASRYRYVRMKVRRIGPGGYDDNDWLGACQAESTQYASRPTDPNSRYRQPGGLSWNQPKLGEACIGANTISQPSTMIIPAGSDPNTKSPWHILEWDMHQIGAGTVPNPLNIGTTRPVFRDHFSGAADDRNYNIGWLGFTLSANPTESVEKYEIDWIQVDDGTKYPRGNHIWPIGRTNQLTELLGERTQESDGAGVGGNPNTLYVNSSWDYSTRVIGEFSLTASVPEDSTINYANTAGNNSTVIYMSKTRSGLHSSGASQINVPTDDQCHILRISANTANTTDWIVTDILQANTEVDNYIIGTDLSSSIQNWDMMGLEIDRNDTLFVGHSYSEDQTAWPGTSNFNYPVDRIYDGSTNARPYFIFHYQPTANVAATGVIGGNTGHSFYGTGNSYNTEIAFYGNTSGTGAEILGNGPRSVTAGNPSGHFTELTHYSGVDMIVSERGHLQMVGRESHNMVMIKPAPGKSRDGTDSEQLPLILDLESIVFDVPYNEGMGTVRVGPDRSAIAGVQEFELANSTTLDSNAVALGTWAPHGIIEGPKGSYFVACNNYNIEFGDNTIYCYHVVPTQNVSTGAYVSLNVYPVYANTAHTTDIFQGCSGMALDHNDPPNLYYATSNTIFKIEPKGYSYEIGDTTITQLIPDTYDYWNTNFTNGATVPPLGWYPGVHTDPTTYPYQMESTYGKIKVDSRGRLFLRGRANVYMFDTSTNVISTAYSPQEYQAEIPTTDVHATYENLTIADWDVEPDTGELVFVLMEMNDGKALVASIRPNSDGSYDLTDTGQFAQVLIEEGYNPNRFETTLPTLGLPGAGAPTGFKTWANAKIRIRKKKDSDYKD